MKNKYNLALPLLFLIILACSCPKEEIRTADTSVPKKPGFGSSPNTTPSPADAPNKRFVDISELVNKSPQEIEEKFGKALKIQNITDNPVKTFNEEREYAVAPVPEDYLLIVRFSQDRAVQFLWNLPSKIGNQNAKEFVEQFGFNVNDMKAENYSMVVNWTGTANGIEYEKISAMKMSDVFNHLTVSNKGKINLPA